MFYLHFFKNRLFQNFYNCVKKARVFALAFFICCKFCGIHGQTGYTVFALAFYLL